MRSRRRVWVARRSIDVVMLVLLIAGVMKALDVAAFASDMRTWTLLPRWAPFLAAPFVPALEIGMALCWFLGIGRRVAAIGAGATLLLFTSIYAVHLLAGEEPRCGCLGLIEAFRNSTIQAVMVLSRNGILLALLAWGIVERSWQGVWLGETPEAALCGPAERAGG
jgi:uncharacterized membrane protein YphA (DoxX/SURF4 family)